MFCIPGTGRVMAVIMMVVICLGVVPIASAIELPQQAKLLPPPTGPQWALGDDGIHHPFRDIGENLPATGAI